MIGSMTQAERENPDLLAASPSRRRRIAAGSGHAPAEVDKVLADFQKMRGFMQQMTRGGMPGMPGCRAWAVSRGWGAACLGASPEPACRDAGHGGTGGRGGRGGGAPKPPRPAKKRKGFGEL